MPILLWGEGVPNHQCRGSGGLVEGTVGFISSARKEWSPGWGRPSPIIQSRASRTGTPSQVWWQVLCPHNCPTRLLWKSANEQMVLIYEISGRHPGPEVSHTPRSTKMRPTHCSGCPGILQADLDLLKVICERLCFLSLSIKRLSWLAKDVYSFIGSIKPTLSSCPGICGKEQWLGDYVPWQAQIYTCKIVQKYMWRIICNIYTCMHSLIFQLC